MQKIKLFFDGHIFDGIKQGSATYMRGLYNHLMNFDDSVDFYFGAHSDDILSREPWLVDRAKFIKFKSANKYCRLGVEIPSIIHRYEIEWAHFQYISPLIKNCRWVTTIYDSLFNHFPHEFPLSYRLSRNLLFAVSAKRSDVVTTISSYSKDAISKDFGLNPSNVYLLPPGPPDSVYGFDIGGPSAKEMVFEKFSLKKYILYVSRLEPRKNHLMLAKAFFELDLDSQGYQLVFVGQRALSTPNLDAYIQNLPVQRRGAVRELSGVADSDLINIYKGAELFVYPSKGEGFGIPPLEAVLLQVPCICSDATAMRDFQVLGIDLFAPDDVELIKILIQKNLNNPPCADVLASIRSRALQAYSWEKTAADFFRILKDKSN